MAIVRLSLNIDPHQDEQIEDYARRHGVTKTAALKRAIGTLIWADSVEVRGAVLCVREADGTMREVVML